MTGIVGLEGPPRSIECKLSVLFECCRDVDGGVLYVFFVDIFDVYCMYLDPDGCSLAVKPKFICMCGSKTVGQLSLYNKYTFIHTYTEWWDQKCFLLLICKDIVFLIKTFCFY